MDDKHKNTIDKIVTLARQDSEFGAELRRRLGVNIVATTLDRDEIDEIYEYCIEKVIARQAQEFYADFPFKQDIDDLVKDFCRMERFRRQDNFYDFSLALLQQLELMTNRLCSREDLSYVVAQMWNCPAYVVSHYKMESSVNDRCSESRFKIVDIVLPGKDEDKKSEKAKKPLNAQYANDKMRIIVYFMGYKAKMKRSDYTPYRNYVEILDEIYTCRNFAAHRGGGQNEWNKQKLKEIFQIKSINYFRFLGALTQYVQYIKDGLENLPELKKYADSLRMVSQ